MELKPRTRKEFLIADFIDKDTPDIVPKTRSEMFLKQMLDKISTGGSGSGGGGALAFEIIESSATSYDPVTGPLNSAYTYDDLYALLVEGKARPLVVLDVYSEDNENERSAPSVFYCENWFRSDNRFFKFIFTRITQLDGSASRNSYEIIVSESEATWTFYEG